MIAFGLAVVVISLSVFVYGQLAIILYHKPDSPFNPSPGDLDRIRRSRLDDMRAFGRTGDAHYLAGDLGCYNLKDGKYMWNTNTDRFWRDIWREGANGLRVQLILGQTNTPDADVVIEVGSVIRNSEGPYFTPTDGKFAKFELRDTNGAIVPFSRNAPLELISSQNVFFHGVTRKPGWLSQWLPSLKDISRQPFPTGRIHVFGTSLWALFNFTNGPPREIHELKFKNIYSIKAEGDYSNT